MDVVTPDELSPAVLQLAHELYAADFVGTAGTCSAPAVFRMMTSSDILVKGLQDEDHGAASTTTAKGTVSNQMLFPTITPYNNSISPKRRDLSL